MFRLPTARLPKLHVQEAMQDGETRATCTCVLHSLTALLASSRTTTQALIAWSCGTRILRFDVLQRSSSELQRLLTGPPAA